MLVLLKALSCRPSQPCHFQYLPYSRPPRFSPSICLKPYCKSLKPEPKSLPNAKSAAPMEWACSNCTFFNQSTSQSCQMCQMPRHTGPVSSLASEWPCRSCTFLNKFGKPGCEMCGTMATGPLASLLIDDELKTIEESAVGDKFRPLQACTTKGESDSVENSGGESPARVSSNTRKQQWDKEEGWVHLKKAKGKESAQGGESSSSAPAPAPISNAFLGTLHRERLSRTSQTNSDVGRRSTVVPAVHGEEAPNCQGNTTLTAEVVNNGEQQNALVFLTYNVWFREDLEVHGRMKAIGELIEQHQPHFICFQEVTPNIYEIFRHSSWWGKYRCSVSPELAAKRAYFCIQLSRVPVAAFRRNPYRNTIMGRELCIADVDICMGKRLVIATSHLESPSPGPPTWDQMYSAERVFQANESLTLLGKLPNVIFGGDMNWDDRLDGAPPLPDGWFDVWVNLRPGQDGWTYDTKSNPMLTGNRLLQKRLDRIFCHFEDFEIESIDMIGTNPIPGLSYKKEKKVRKQTQILNLPVLPSDHYGLLLKIRPTS